MSEMSEMSEPSALPVVLVGGLHAEARRDAAALEWEPEFGDRAQHLVFTGPALDEDGLRALLGSCLLTNAEYAAGRESWRRLGSAFDELLDPVS